MKNNNKFRLDVWGAITLATIALYALFLLYPMAYLIRQSVMDPDTGGFTLAYFTKFFSKSYYFDTLINSFKVSITATVLSIAIGTPLAYLFTIFKIKGKSVLNILIVVASMSAPFIGAYSWILLLGRSGVITTFFKNLGIAIPDIYGFGGIVLVMTLQLFPLVFLYAKGALKNIDNSLIEAAENLGCSGIACFFKVVVPLIMPTLLAAALLVFMRSFADFGTPMLIGEGYMVLPVLVYNEYMSEIGGNAHLASALSVVVVLCSTTVLLVQKYFVSRKNYVMTAMRPPKEEVLHGGKRFLVTLPVLLVTLIGIMPQIVVIVSSFIKCDFTGFQKGFSLDSYATIFNRLWTNIRNTFVFSSIAIVFIIILGMLISYIVVRQKGLAGQLMDLLIMFPFVIPGAVLGISLIVAFNKQPVILTGTAMIMIIAFIVRKLPYTVRSGSAFLQQMDVSVEEASISLGVSPMKTFVNVTARLMAPGVLSGAILSWITCINELSSSVMLYGGKTSTISVAIYTEVVRNSFGTAAALASILTVSTVISLLIFLKVSKGRVSVV